MARPSTPKQPARPRQGVPEEERLPWLEPAVAMPARRPSRWGLWLVLGLILVSVAIVAALWRRAPAGGPPGLILAPPGPYKIKPPEAGGMIVEGAGYTSYAASEGNDPAGRIDTSAMPETPVKPAPKAPAAPVADPPVADAPVGSGTIQLGAFSTEAKANAAWKALSARFAFLAPFTPVIVAAKPADGGATVYRLRSVAGQAAVALCGRMKVAGESCQVVGP